MDALPPAGRDPPKYRELQRRRESEVSVSLVEHGLGGLCVVVVE